MPDAPSFPTPLPSPIALIGFGAFARLIAEHLRPHTELLAHDPAIPAGDIQAVGITPATLAEAAAAPVIVLAVPVQRIELVCQAIAPHISGDALVLDVASVKASPAAWMQQHLPAHAQILATHPLFGPQTAAERGSIAGEPIAYCPVRLDPETDATARHFLEHTLSLRVIDITPDDHDRQMADVQVITHLVSHAARDLDLPPYDTATRAYRRLLQMKANTERDSEELFDAIQRLNPHAKDARKRFLKAVHRIVERADALDAE